MKKVLLISPSEAVSVYKDSQIKEAVMHAPYLSLASLAATLLEKKHEVKILDLSLFQSPRTELENTLKEFQPDFVGITFTTPLYEEMKGITQLVKDFNKDIIIIGGGPHCSALPKQSLKESNLDVVCIGEGDYTIVDIVENLDNLKEVKGIAYQEGEEVILTATRPPIEDLDKLPFPAWHLFDIEKYKNSPLRVKQNPVGPIETSRGCPGKCTFCSKVIVGFQFRTKSPKRVVDEIEYMLKCGFKEIHIFDDTFTADIKHATDICDLILERNLKFPWVMHNGTRVDSINRDLFFKLKKAGCYNVAFGIESGNQEVLNSIRKEINLDQVRRAVKYANEAGLETLGFFIIGLPKDNHKTIKQTIKFASSLNLDLAKATIFMPFPGTVVFNQLDKEGLILSKDWSKYNYHSPHSRNIYKHPNLTWDELVSYQSQLHRKFYLRPKKLVQEFIKSIKDHTFFYKLKVASQVKW